MKELRLFLCRCRNDDRRSERSFLSLCNSLRGGLLFKKDENLEDGEEEREEEAAAVDQGRGMPLAGRVNLFSMTTAATSGFIVDTSDGKYPSSSVRTFFIRFVIMYCT
jgi:hypothetical protein